VLKHYRIMDYVIFVENYQFNAANQWVINRCVTMSIGDKPCRPELDHFELIDFAFIVEVQGRTSICDGIITDL
jgi:hypothetical protein